ncbi:MAG TPA: SRPBCC domain-containing protein [Polyangiales bacterium]|nr:SRPBCC domain-containing protein [Polyangiales bacterium]
MSQNKLEFVVDPVDPIITVRRVVDAPRALVWDCFTKLEHVRRWKGPKGVDMIECDMDVRPGGTWRVLYRRPDGVEFGFHGEFREVTAPERYVRTFVMASGDESVETVVLTEAGPGKTLITTKNTYKTNAIRDAFVQQGSGSGEVMYLRLDELLESLKSSR